MQFPDGVPEDLGHTGSAKALARAASDALRADDTAAAIALTSLAQVHAMLALTEVQQQLVWVTIDIRQHLEVLRLDAVPEIARVLRERTT
ncbi:hypothetical protein AB0D66_32495 [Streptomyces sp. NPDC048270]|uniref:hypothetical protein n=1 Tax=Streptomyces sp. NPDC048270 TaxID=3154615 RepID=UPI00340FB0CA